MERIAIIGENSIEYIEELLNIWNLGNCAVLIDWRTPAQSIIEMLQSANVKKCLIQKNLYKRKNLSSNLGINFQCYEVMQTKSDYVPQIY